ncbi:MAG: extracellular solute-binding protein [Clostridia bacterium]|nr:extracellular solute-binding protein [Clostridia bacterium]
MKHFRRLCVLLLAALVLGTSCAKTGTETDAGEAVEKTEILTNVFKGTGISLPEEYSLNTQVKPYYNAETGEMRVFCTCWRETGIVDENGYAENIRENILLTIGADGSVVDEKILAMGDAQYVNHGVLTEDRFYFVYNTYDETVMKESYYAGIYELAEDRISASSDDLSGLFAQQEGGWFYIDKIAVDGDGMIYISSDQEILVTNEAFVKQFSVTASNWVEEMVTAADGTVYIAGYMDNGYGFTPIDKAAKAFGETKNLPSNLNAQQYLLADGYDIFLSADDGLYGYNFAEEAPEMVFSYANSDLFGNNLDIASIVDTDCVILYERDPDTYEMTPAIYRRSEDIDLSQVKVLEIAYTSSDWQMSSDIVKFNKANDGVRIVARDYSQYNTDEDYNAGTTKLVNDILLGLYKPDLVTGYGVTDDVIAEVYANGLYADLYPLMEADGTISKDDLLGCVKRSFESADGKLWVLGDSVAVQTIMGTKEMLGDRKGWTLSEMIDFAEGLPEGTSLKRGLNQQTALYDLLGRNGYGMFIDTETNTCNFESEDFIRYLEYLVTLPASNKPANRAEAEAMAVASSGNDDGYLAYHNGQIALTEMYYHGVNDWVRMEATFNTPDVVNIGYPTADGKTNGAQMNITPYMITSFCEYPDEAWDFIEFIIGPEEKLSEYGSHNGLPVLKDKFMQVCESEYDSLFEVHFSGGMSWGTYNPEYDDLDAEMREPGIRKFFTEEDAQAMLKWFDEELGAPAAEAVDAEITEIVNEEITTYLGGAKSAADCARIIQSRVSIWLSEHE